ncbi:unnamed protein product, partial [Ixodes persulcatus]
ERYETDPEFSDRVITGDETWIFEYDPESKQQRSEWHTTKSRRPKKARMSKSQIKAMLIVFDRKGVVHSEFVPQGQAVNKELSFEVLKRLHNRVRRVQKEIRDNLILHHDNAPSHTMLIVSEL